MTDVASYYDSIASNYGTQYDPDKLLTHPEYPAEYFRLQILLQRLHLERIESVYEIGVGSGEPLLEIAKRGIKVAGCDASAEMVKRARSLFAQADMFTDFNPQDIAHMELVPGMWLGPENCEAWQAVVAFGVLPHVKDDDWFLQMVRQFLRPGGRCFIEFRNQLFSLFTFNRHTRDFILDDLLQDVAPELKEIVAFELDHCTNEKEPPQRAFDTIARFHNPLELIDTFHQNGFSDLSVHYYHFHPTPPSVEIFCQKNDWRKEAFRMEQTLTQNWRGMFLCSAGVIEAVKK